jgi:PhoPQ-activated pathogenicity-related protein
VDTVESFFLSVISDTPMPEYSWEYKNDNILQVTTKNKPTAVKLWKATNPEARNFRLDVTGELYEEVPLEVNDEGVYEVNVPDPEKGWTAYFVELTYDGPSEAPIRLTTPIKVVPETYPHKFERAPKPPNGFLSK